MKPPIVFFGSGPVAAKSLELLLSDFKVVGVVTKPKPDHHHGNFPVIDVAEAHGLALYTVRNKKELSELVTTKPFSTEVAILIDFGIIVSQDVIDYFPKGIINSHFSLLPEWRGADPITFAILSGQNTTGVSLMLLVKAMDEGPVLAYAEYDLPAGITSPDLTKELIELSDGALKQIVPLYLSGTVDPKPQVGIPTYSRKLTKEDGVFDITKPAEDLEREVRAYIEWPKSRTKLANIDVIITAATVSDDSGKAGTVSIKDKQLLLYCGTGALTINELKPAGKQAMSAEAFIAGYKDKLS